MPTDPTPVQDLFLKIVDLPPGERAAVLEVECAGDHALRRRVEALLAAHDEADSYLDRATLESGLAPGDESAPALDVTSELRPQAEPGAVIGGRYTLQQRIGEGGMGEVWVAKQTEPVKRKVALKLIKAGMDSRAVLTRFEQERQALAMMDHPHIARVLDGGLTPSGQPFFVMELVNGLPLTRFCDESKLTPRERLELFVPICQAVQHAHQKGIVHRDLKPANILVTLIDGRPVPKVIDFGVAKATGGKLTDESMSTQFGAVVGTLEYMSPEQAGYAGTDIDTRADIYSLGVILYELLTGLRPIDARRLEQAGMIAMIRVILEEEPARPSTRLSTDESLPSLAALRQTDPKKLTALLRGELDWVVMKCLEKKRDRRYETASGLARDIERYLDDEPVEARPPSAGYRLKKFVRRNRPQVIAASLVLLALVAGAVGTTVGMVQATRAAEAARVARNDAVAQQALAEKAAEQERQARVREQERAEGERKAKEEAQRNLTFAEKGNEILGSVFTGLDPRQNYATVGEFSQALKGNLKNAVRELEGSAIGDPLVVAQMQNHLALSLMGLGDAPSAVVLFEKALEARKTQLGLDHPYTLTSMNNLAVGYSHAGKLDLALPLFEENLKLVTAKLGADHPHTLSTMNNLAENYRAAGKLDLALPLFEETLKLTKAKVGADHPHTLVSMDNLAHGYQVAGQLDKALPLYEETLVLRTARLGPDHPDTLAALNQVSLSYLAIAAQQAWFGEDQQLASTCEKGLLLAKDTNEPTVAERMAKICSLRPLDEQQHDAALVLARQAVELGEGHQLLPYFQMALGMAEYRSGHFAETDAALASAMEGGKFNSHVAGTSAFYLAMSLLRQGKPGEAHKVALDAAATMNPLPDDEQIPLAAGGNADDLILWMAYKEAKELIALDEKKPEPKP